MIEKIFCLVATLSQTYCEANEGKGNLRKLSALLAAQTLQKRTLLQKNLLYFSLKLP
jgi:hypothetical protein